MTGIFYDYDSSNYDLLVKYVLSHGELVSPHSVNTIELTNMHIVMPNPRMRVITDSARKMNIGFAIAEFMQCVTGDNDIHHASLYNKNMKQFAFRDVVDAAYGPRLISEQLNQIENVIFILKQDSFSRQAVLSIFRKEDQLKWGNIPCTISLQFLLRNNKLNCIATMRSNDALWGFTYDVFVFTMIQEYIATRLGVYLGSYSHNVGSFHVYMDRDNNIINKLSPGQRIAMNEMDAAIPFLGLHHLSQFLFAEEAIVDSSKFIANGFTKYWQDILSSALCTRLKKNSNYIYYVRDISDLALKAVLE